MGAEIVAMLNAATDVRAVGQVSKVEPAASLQAEADRGMPGFLVRLIWTRHCGSRHTPFGGVR